MPLRGVPEVGPLWRWRGVTDHAIWTKKSMTNAALQSTGDASQGPAALRLKRRQNATMYAWSLLLVATAFALRSLLAPTLGNQALYLFLVPPVLIAGVLWGLGPGLFATILSLAFHLYATGEFSNLIHPESPFFATELA